MSSSDLSAGVEIDKMYGRQYTHSSGVGVTTST